VCGGLDNVCQEEDMMKTSKAMKKKRKSRSKGGVF